MVWSLINKQKRKNINDPISVISTFNKHIPRGYSSPSVVIPNKKYAISLLIYTLEISITLWKHTPYDVFNLFALVLGPSSESESSCCLLTGLSLGIALCGGQGWRSHLTLFSRKSLSPGGRPTSSRTSRWGGMTLRMIWQHMNWRDVGNELLLITFMPLRAAVDDTTGYSVRPWRPW